jgi:hypothetical protein
VTGCQKKSSPIISLSWSSTPTKKRNEEVLELMKCFRNLALPSSSSVQLRFVIKTRLVEPVNLLGAMLVNHSNGY